MRQQTGVAAIFAIFLVLRSACAEPVGYSVEPNVVYGMYSGLALTMDIYRPTDPNGLGVVFIRGCAWHSEEKWNAFELNYGGGIETLAKPLARAGFTVFRINHRTAPRFRFPAHLEDARRSVQWVKDHADDYAIDATRLAAVGGSSGGHLSLLLGLLPLDGNTQSTDPIERQSSKVSCVVAFNAATDLTAGDWSSEGTAIIASLIGKPNWPMFQQAYYEASPVSHARGHGGIKFLLIHGDNDEKVPYSQSTVMTERLKSAGASVKLVTIKGVGHGIPQLVGSVEDSEQLPHPMAIADWLTKSLVSEE